MKKSIYSITVFFVVSACIAQSNLNTIIQTEVENQLSSSNKLYINLHQSPKLSYLEFETAKKMAFLLNNLGFETTEKIGGNGVVGVFKNGLFSKFPSPDFEPTYRGAVSAMTRAIIDLFESE